jgi:hypothetical protein
LPAGATLDHGDLVVVRARLPTTALRHYLQPTPGQTVAGRVLAAPVRQETLVAAELQPRIWPAAQPGPRGGWSFPDAVQRVAAHAKPSLP